MSFRPLSLASMSGLRVALEMELLILSDTMRVKRSKNGEYGAE